MRNHYIEDSKNIYKDKIFISFSDQHITFDEFYHNVSIKSRAITNLDLTNSSKLGIFLSHPVDILEIYFSCLQLGKIPIILPLDISSNDLQTIIDSYQIKFIISEWVRKKQITKISGASFFYNQELSSGYGGCGATEFSSIISNIDSTQSMHLTSGSTGAPKLIPLSFNNFINSVAQWHDEIKFSESDKYIQCLPLNHIAGLSIIIRSQLKGFEAILMNKFNSSSINFEIDNGATLISLIPSMLKRLLDNRCGKPFPKHLKAIIVSGDSVSRAVMEQALKAKAPIYKSYGMTETCSGICGFWLGKHPEMIDSVGKSFNKTNIKIHDSSIHIKGPSVTSASNEKGVFKTADIGYFKNRFLFISGRSDDIIISGGENISLSQIKNILLKHPDISDTYLSSTPDDEYGHLITAYIELKKELSENEILTYCKSLLSKKQLPQRIQIVDKINHDLF